MLTISGCTITVPVNQPSVSVSSTPKPTYAPPTIQAGHNAAAVAAKNMSFQAGNSLSPGVAVGFSDVLGQGEGTYSDKPQPPEWKLLAQNVAGRTSYSNQSGCLMTYWTTANQGPLIVAGDDRASTLKLFGYLIPSVVPGALAEATWPWVSEAGKNGPTISFLRYNTKASASGPASALWARMLGTSNTGLVISLSCPTDALLASTAPRLAAKLTVAPPTE